MAARHRRSVLPQQGPLMAALALIIAGGCSQAAMAQQLVVTGTLAESNKRYAWDGGAAIFVDRGSYDGTNIEADYFGSGASKEASGIQVNRGGLILQGGVVSSTYSGIWADSSTGMTLDGTQIQADRYGIYVENSGRASLSNLQIRVRPITAGPGAPIGINTFGSSGSARVELRDSSIDVQGDAAVGLRAGAGGGGTSVIEMQGGRIDATGQRALGASVSAERIALTGTTVAANGQDSAAAQVSGVSAKQGQLELNSVTATARGANSSGVRVQFYGNAAITDSTLDARGDGAMGLYMDGFSGGSGNYPTQATVQRGSITADGIGSRGVFAHVNTDLTLTGTRITASGSDSVAALFEGTEVQAHLIDVALTGDTAGVRVQNAATLELQRGSIAVTGAGAIGLDAASAGVLTARGTQVSAFGSNAIGVRLIDASATADLGGLTVQGDATGVQLGGVLPWVLNDFTVSMAGNGATGLSMGRFSKAQLSGGAWTVNGAGALAANVDDASTLTATGSRFQADGSGARAVRVDGAGSLARLTSASVGGSATGALVQNQGVLQMDGGRIVMTGDDAIGIDADTAATVTSQGTYVAAFGRNAIGVRLADTGTQASFDTLQLNGDHTGVAVGNGARLMLSRSNLTLVGDNATALTLAGGSTAQLNGGGLLAAGAGALAAAVGAGASLDANGTHLQGDGADAVTLSVEGAGAVAHLTGGTSIGGSGTGARVRNAGTLRIDGGLIGVMGDDSIGLDAGPGASVSTDATQVSAFGRNAIAVRIADGTTQARLNALRVTGDHIGLLLGSGARQALSGANFDLTGDGVTALVMAAGSSAQLDGGALTAKGTGATAASLATGASATLRGTTLHADGVRATGLSIGAGANAVIQQSLLVADGANATGIALAPGAGLDATGLSISTADVGSVGIHTTSQGAAATMLSLASSSVRSAGTALQSDGDGATTMRLRDSWLRGGNGRLLTAGGDGSLSLLAEGSTLIGDMVGSAGTAVALAGRSTWSGTGLGIGRLDVGADSHWLLQGSSTVGMLGVAGTIEFDPATAGNPYKTLTAGTLAMQGGTFILNSRLDAGNTAETDRVSVLGDSSGSGYVVIRNNGGEGAGTGHGPEQGIRIIDIAGASNAKFALAAPAIVGVYDYQLVKADGQNWYLQTPRDDGGEEGGEDGGEEGGEDGGEDGGTIVELIPGYVTALSAGLRHADALLGSFHQRLGEQRWRREEGFTAWARGIGGSGRYAPRLSGLPQRGYSLTLGGAQVGADYSIHAVAGVDDMLSVGLMADAATSNADVRDHSARVRLRSIGGGGYLSWQQHATTGTGSGQGFYADAVLRRDHLDTRVRARSVSGFELFDDYRGRAWSASLEGGYGFALANRVVLQPQLQVTWTALDNKDFTDRYGLEVGGQRARSLQARLGVRMEKTLLPGGDGVDGRSTTLFWDANVRHEFKGDARLQVFDRDFGSDAGGTTLVVGGGVVAQLSANLSVYARASAEVGGRVDLAGAVSGGIKLGF